jgi:Glucodextranase, domain N
MKLNPDPLHSAPGGPGIEPRWTHGAKTAIGTAYSTSSRIWYTLDAGCVTEGVQHARYARSPRMLAMAHPQVLPSALLNDVGTPVAIISQLNTLPALPPVNASMAALRLVTHDSGPGWFATNFLYDSFIHNSTPVLSRRTQQPARA